MRYDVTGDGELDEREWELVRRMIAVELKTAEERDAEWSLDAEPQILRDRYEVVGLLGRGGQAYTYLARDLANDGRHVVVKELRIHLAHDWKSIELFERECELLSQLTHPRIPRYLDSFHLEDDDVRFMLVQDFVDGQDLEHFVQSGGRWDESEAIRRLAEVGEILEYLHRRSPPVLHRDIKPSNIIIGRDDALYLVDFGAVQTVVADTVGGSTIIGTTGYVPMEQYMGRAQPASDIYALGATAVHLMTGTHPADLPFVRGRLDHRSRLTASPLFVALLEQMLAPVVEDRPANATELLARLGDLSNPALKPAPKPVEQTHPSIAMALWSGSSDDRWKSSVQGRALVHIDRTRPWLQVTRAEDALTRTVSDDQSWRRESVQIVANPRSLSLSLGSANANIMVAAAFFACAVPIVPLAMMVGGAFALIFGVIAIVTALIGLSAVFGNNRVVVDAEEVRARGRSLGQPRQSGEAEFQRRSTGAWFTLPTDQVSVKATSDGIVFSAGSRETIGVDIKLPPQQLEYIAALLNKSIEELRTTDQVDMNTIK